MIEFCIPAVARCWCAGDSVGDERRFNDNDDDEGAAKVAKFDLMPHIAEFQLVLCLFGLLLMQ